MADIDLSQLGYYAILGATVLATLLLAWVALGAIATSYRRYPPRLPFYAAERRYIVCGRRAWGLAALLTLVTLWAGYRAIELAQHRYLLNEMAVLLSILRLYIAGYLTIAFWPRRE